MSGRREVLDALEELAFAADMLDEPSAARAQRAAWAIRNQSGDLHALLESGELAKLRGVGEQTLSVVRDVLAGQPPAALVERKARLPAGLFQIRKVKGLGAKKIKAIRQALRVETLSELEYACRENRLRTLPGFGEKTQARVLAEAQRLLQQRGRHRRDEAEAILQRALKALRAHPGVARAAVVGDYATGCEIVDALAVLVEPVGRDASGAHASAAGLDLAGLVDEGVAVHLASPAGFGFGQVVYTSTEEHLGVLARRAADAGLRWDRAAGLDDIDGPRRCDSEADVYEALGVHPVAAPRRRGGTPLVPKGQRHPRLVQRKDLLGAIHNHTTASDGAHSLEVMQRAAAARGLSYLGISEHSQTAHYARGLDEARVRAQIAEIHALNATPGVSGCTLVPGIESDILADGALDLADEVLAELTFVVASVHRRYSQDAPAMTARILRALAHPATAVLGHPTGRLLLGRAPADYDVEAVLDACRKRGRAVELNAHPQRLDFGVRHLEMAKSMGVPVSIAADAHRAEGLDHLEHGVAVAQRAGLTPDDVLNTRPLPALLEWLAAARRGSTALPHPFGEDAG